MAASYPTTIKSFETKSTGNVIYTTHITDLEEEVVAIETALKTGPTALASASLSSATASQAVFTNGSKQLVSNAITGSGNVVMSASPTLTGTIAAAAASFSGAVTLTGGLNTPLVVAQGGTGLATLTSAGVLVGAGTGTPTTVAPSTSGNLLTSTGSAWASTAPAAAGAEPHTNDFRLTLTSATPVTTADVSAATTLYLTPYIGPSIAIYTGSAWAVLTSAQVSIALGGLTASKPYDVWAYDSGSSTLALEVLVWTDDTTRATALARQNGVLVKNGDATRRYVGTIYVDAAGGAVTNAFHMRHVWNYSNRITLPMRKMFAGNWSYATNSFRQAKADASYQLAFVVGVAEEPVEATYHAQWTSLSVDQVAEIGVGLDSTSAAAAGSIHPAGGEDGGNDPQNPVATLITYPAAGKHKLVALERGYGTQHTWYGGAAFITEQLGLVGKIEG